MDGRDCAEGDYEMKELDELVYNLFWFIAIVVALSFGIVHLRQVGILK